MSVIEHLRELRTRIFKALAFVLVGMVVGFVFYDYVLAFLQRPYCALPADLRLGGKNCDLVLTDVTGGLLLRLKIAFFTGLVVSSPGWLYQLWAFITPGLKRNEKKWAVAFVATSTFLFLLGTVCAFFTLQAGLKVLLGLAGSEVSFLLTAPDYIGFVITLLVVFGVSFELPLIVVMLNLARILKYDLLKKSRRWLMFLTFVFAALITPTQDPFSMLAMAVPMALLFEGSIQFARINDKRVAAREAGSSWDHIDDDAASPLDVSASAVSGAEPTPTATPRGELTGGEPEDDTTP